MKVLITGGAGYIGSTTARALEDAGHVPIILDSLLTGPREFVGQRIFYQGDIADRRLVGRIVEDHPDLACTVHMAARIVVPESVAHPYEYYRDNVSKSLELVDELVRLGKPSVVFSSSAAVYAAADGFEVTEDSPLAPDSPYARSKLMVEDALRDMSRATSLRSLVLRYFNPIGSDPWLTTGSYARDPSHVLGRMIESARNEARPPFVITGVDLPTRDGTGIRDYLHVWDLARAHVAAVERFDDVTGCRGSESLTINVGTGRGVTVRELLTAFEGVLGRRIPTREGPSRPGDVVGAYANVDRARELIGWSSEHTLEEAIASALAWARSRGGDSTTGFSGPAGAPW